MYFVQEWLLEMDGKEGQPQVVQIIMTNRDILKRGKSGKGKENYSL